MKEKIKKIAHILKDKTNSMEDNKLRKHFLYKKKIFKQ